MTDAINHHPGAENLKKLLLAALLLAMAWLAWSGYRLAGQNLEQLRNWPRHPAQIVSLGDEAWVELEIPAALGDTLRMARVPDHAAPTEPGKLRLLLPRQPDAWYDLFDQVELLQDPADPDHLVLASLPAMWLPVLSRLLLLGLLAMGWKVLSAAPWGRDQSWSGGQWLDTEMSGVLAGSGASSWPDIREAPGSRKAVTFWVMLFSLLALSFLPWLLELPGEPPLEAQAVLALLLGLLGLALVTAIETFSRSLRFDANGLSDRTFFRTRRVPWGEVGGVERVNLSASAQRRYDQASRKSGMRPASLPSWEVRDRQGHTVLRLGARMEPEDAFAALLTRLRRPLEASVSSDLFGAADAEPAADETARALPDEEEADAASLMRIPPEFRQPQSILDRRHRGMLVGMALALLPFLLGTGALCYQTLWFKFVAAQVQGQVVEVRSDGLPSLVVEYRAGDGRLLRTESDGSDAYAGFAVGDSVRVFYDPAEPEHARLDFFLEHWLLAMLLGGLTLLLLLAMVLIARGFTRPFPRL